MGETELSKIGSILDLNKIRCKILDLTQVSLMKLIYKKLIVGHD